MFDHEANSAITDQYDSLLTNEQRQKDPIEFKDLELQDTVVRLEPIIMEMKESIEINAILQRLDSKVAPLMSDQKAQMLKQQVEPSLEDTNEFKKIIGQVNLALKIETRHKPYIPSQKDEVVN